MNKSAIISDDIYSAQLACNSEEICMISEQRAYKTAKTTVKTKRLQEMFQTIIKFSPVQH